MKLLKRMFSKHKPVSDIFDEPTNKELLKELIDEIKTYEWRIDYHKDQAIYYKQKLVLTKMAIEMLEKNT